MVEGNKCIDYVFVSNIVIGVILFLFGSVGLLNVYLSIVEFILFYSFLGLVGVISVWFLLEI